MAEDQHNDWHTDKLGQTGQDAGSPAGPVGGPVADPAAQALAGALKLSFRLLTVIMALVVVAFLLTGIRQVKTDQVGIRSRFGRITGTAEAGLTYTWPFPVGRLDIVDLSTRKLAINDFWLYVSPADRTKELSDIRTRDRGLKPGRDGVLLAGDGNLLHVKLVCTYGVRPGRDHDLGMDYVELFVINVNDQAPEQARKRGQPLRSEQIIRSVVCQAAIRTAATRTAEMLRIDTSSFTSEVEKLAQRQLDAMRTGLAIRAVNAVNVSWPLRVLPDVAELSSAQQDVARLRRDAEAAAQSLLSRTAGKSYEVLIGSLDGGGEPGLIPRYTLARRQEQDQLAEQLLGKIDKVLMSDVTTGRAQTIIQQALSDRAAMVEPIKGRLARFQQLLPQYKLYPDFTVARLWADTRDAILENSVAEKFYINEGDGRVVLRINRDPRVARALQRQLLAEESQEEEK